MAQHGGGWGSSGPGCASVRLLGGFALLVGGARVPLPEMAAKVVAYAALEGRPVTRRTLAGALWPRSSRQRAHGALRTTLYRAQGIDHALVVGSEAVALAPGVSVDTQDVLRSVPRGGSPDPRAPINGVPIEWLSKELLPEWCDDWVVPERERFRLLALATLEELSARYAERGDSTLAVDCAMAAVRLEPVRESAHRALMAAHLTTGNASEALEQYGSYRRILAAELSLEPSPKMAALVRSIVRQSSPTRGSAPEHPTG